MRSPLTLLSLITVASLTASAPRNADRVLPNDNRQAAGTVRDGVLSIQLEARAATWYPEGDDGPSVDIPAFAEVGKPARVPGPLIRVRAGTRVSATMRNSLPNDTLRVHGLFTRAAGATAGAPFRLAPGEQRSVTFQLDAAGTYFYWATTMSRPLTLRFHEDAQLNGAIIVDSAAAPPSDRVFMLGMWSDTTGAAVPVGRKRMLFTINGRAWPHTERLKHTVGDTVRWHVINPTADIHPMHLHGFYFTVDSRGDGVADTSYAAANRDHLVTELMTRGQTIRMSWIPDRDGTWAYHCHIPNHIEHRGPLGTIAGENGQGADHAAHAMSNLVLSIFVSPRRGQPSTAATSVPGRRRFRLVIDETPNAGQLSTLSFALGEAGAKPKRADAATLGPPIVVNAGDPVSVTVVNRSSLATAIHWHGIELESYFDGIAGFSGTPMKLSPMVAPSDSFEARFRPPRAGTFIYHSHVDETRQQNAGLTGTIVVLGKGQRFDPATNIFGVITTPPDDAIGTRTVLLNGSANPSPVPVRVGVRHRVRFVNITTNSPGLRVELHRDSTVSQWRVLARDGAELSPHRQVVEQAARPLSIGQTLDVEVTPATLAPLRLVVRASNGVPIASMELRPTN